MWRGILRRTAEAVGVLAVVGLVPSAAAATVLTGTLDAISPPESADYFGEATGLASGRIVLSAPRSTCGAAKPFPGVSVTPGPYRYDVFTFTALESRCLTVRVQRVGLVGEPHVSAYAAFNPGDLAEGYLADSGTSALGVGAIALSMNVLVGQTYTLVVSDRQPSNEGARYELTFDEPFTGAMTSVSTPPSSPMYFGEFAGDIAGPRVFRDGAPSSCGVPRAFPGTVGTVGPYRYDTFQFVASLSGCVTVRLRFFGGQGFAGFGSVHAYANYFSPADVTSGWLAEAGVGVTSPSPTASFSMNVVAGQTYALVVVNAVAGESSLAYELDVSVPIQPPRLFRTSAQDGGALTFRWAPPIDGPPPTGYVIEGGVNSGQVLASLPTATAVPVTALHAPDGAFYVRARSIAGAESSGPSNEVRVFVNTPAVPSPPVALTGLVIGATLTLSWRNTFGGAPPTGLVLDVTGSAVTSIPLPLAQSASFAAVPGGAYTLRLRAANAAGTSSQSNAIPVHVPSACPGGPRPPADFLTYRVGSTVVAVWDPPTTGPAATSFILDVTGAFIGSFPTSRRSISGAVPPGTYTLAVRAQNACGTSVATPVQTVVVPAG